MPERDNSSRTFYWDLRRTRLIVSSLLLPTGLSYLWLCRSTKIDFPENLLPGIELPSTPYDTSDVTSMDKNSSHHRGCYGDGNFTLPGSHATVSVNSTRMRENETYVIMLVLSKGDRRAFAYQVLEVVQGDPPVIAIE